MSKIDIDKFVEHLVKLGALDCNAVQSALFAQGLIFCNYKIQKIGENSPDPQFGKPINKVEPKFKDGDVLCYKDEISLYKHDIKNCTKQETTFGGFVYHCCYDGKRFITDSLYSLTEQDKMDIHPATKEQRDLLFSKMKEAGYTFDFEKKELKKIEQPELTEFEEAVKDMIDDYRDAIDAHAATTEEVKERAAYMLSLIPHKSAEWSEEDEHRIKDTIYFLETAKKHYASTVELDACINWLKSLRLQPKQKWSEEDQNALEDVREAVVNYWGGDTQDILLYWLKSIKQRIGG